MNLRRLLLGALGTAGVVSASNAVLQQRAGQLDPPVAGTARTYRWRGMDVAYVEAGDPGDETILFLHGIDLAASSREFRAAFEALADEYHVVAPDLPGFGRSDRPNIGYDGDLYVDFVREFAADVTPGGTCVAASLSGSYAVLAQRETGVFSRLVLVCPTGTTRAIRRPLRRRVLSLPLVGTTAFNLLVSKPVLRLRALVAGESPDTETTDYAWRSAHQPGARFAPAAYLSGRLDPVVSLPRVLEDVDSDVTLVWGAKGEAVPLSYGRDLAEAADARLVVLDGAGVRPHVEFPDSFTDLLREDVGAGEVVTERPT